MKVEITKGVMIKGTPVFPQKGKGKAVIVDVSKSEAKALISAGQAKLTDQKAKPTIEIKDPESTGEDAALDEFFGDEQEDE